jgi:hypothetical protein
MRTSNTFPAKSVLFNASRAAVAELWLSNSTNAKDLGLLL